MDNHPECRFCKSPLDTVCVDLGMSPLCQRHVRPNQLNMMEPFYPLKVWVCKSCWLVQLEEYVAPEEIFSDYEYFSSYSDSWVAHAKRYVDMISDRLALNDASFVVEIASNDGYLLQHFVAEGIRCLGIEPAANVAQVANERGIETIASFFGASTAREVEHTFGKADLIAGNNVLAHVPDINDFVAGLKVLLAENGVVTLEFPHLVRLIEGNQFDTIYHEHFSYLLLSTVSKIMAAHGLRVFDVEELSTHGGSIRVYSRHDRAEGEVGSEVGRILDLEKRGGYLSTEAYANFDSKVRETKRRLLSFLISARNDGKSVVGYGAPGKGNTLLNYCGIRTDLLDYTVDRSPHKQGNYTPGTRIPILDPAEISRTRPDFVLILPWNLKEEIAKNMEFIREWGGKFVVPIPTVEIF